MQPAVNKLALVFSRKKAL